MGFTGSGFYSSVVVVVCGGRGFSALLKLGTVGWTLHRPSAWMPKARIQRYALPPGMAYQGIEALLYAWRGFNFQPTT